MSNFFSEVVDNFSSSGGGREEDRYTETDTYSSGNRYGGGGYTETDTYTSDSYGGPPPPPQVPYPWRAHWDDRERRYVYIHEETGERVWEFEEVQRRVRGGRGGGGYYEQDTTTYYDDNSRRGYGGDRVYESEQVYEERDSGRRGHGMAYAGLGAAGGLAGGAFVAHEGHEIRDDYEYDKYRVENDVDNFPENAAGWAGRKVGEVEAIPQDIEYGVDRFDNRVEQGFDNAVDDVVDAPENMANWAGRKVGDVERFDDNVDSAYDQGKYEGRNDW